MKKILLTLLTLLTLAPASGVTLDAGPAFLRLNAKNFTFDLPSGLLYWSGEYISYGRLDSLSGYSTLFYPYRKYHSTRLRVSNSKVRGLRGFLFSYGDISASIALEDAFSFALGYENKYFDSLLIYYDSREENTRSIIENYRREEMKDVYSLILRGKWESYLDALTVLSFSPLVGIDGFYRLKGSYEGLSISLSYGNTFLSSSDDLFQISASLRSRYLDFDYSIKYSESSIYTDFFRSFSSSYDLTIKYNGVRVKSEIDYSFSQSAEIEQKRKVSVLYKGIYLSLDEKMRIHFYIKRGNFEIGVGDEGSYFSYRFNKNFTLSYEGGKIDAEMRIDF